jgi:hypothetical protein
MRNIIYFPGTSNSISEHEHDLRSKVWQFNCKPQKPKKFGHFAECVADLHAQYQQFHNSSSCVHAIE